VCSATGAHGPIIEQGEGARGDWRTAHYGRFFKGWKEHAEMKRRDPGFEPARPVVKAFTRQPYDVAEAQAILGTSPAIEVAGLFSVAYELVLHVLTRYFTHTDETPEQLAVLSRTAIGLMVGVLRPLGVALTMLPAGPRYPGRTAGPTFEMHYQMGNVLPWREPAWRIIHERLVVLGDRCVGLADQAAVPDQVRAAADRTRRIAAQFGAHVPAV
jgi:hypothetical protein